MPAYIFVVILSALLLSPLSTLSFSNYFTSIDLYKYLIANLFFLNFLHPDLPGIFTSPQLTSDINGALWTIKVEVMFYLAIPLIIYFLSRKKNKFTFFIIIYLISIAYKNFFEFYSTENNNFLMYARQLPGFMSYFICGIYLNYYKNTFITHKTQLVLLALPVFVIEYYFNNEIFTPIALATIIFFIAFSFPSLNFFGRKHDISYGIYIYHCPIIKTITYFGYFSQYNPYLVSLFTIVIILIVASLSWRFIEKPFLRLARNIQS